MRAMYPQSHFRLGQPVHGDDFFGRQEELARMLLFIEAGSAVNIFSIRRMGKTSLLFQVSYLCERDARWSCFHPVFLDTMAMLDESLASYLLWRLDAQAGKRLRFDDAWREVERHLQTTSGKSLLLLDECNYWLQRGNHERDLAPLRALQQSGVLNVVASTLYGSLLDQLQHLTEMASPFYNIFHVLRLPSFSREEAVELLTTVCQRSGAELDTASAEELAHYVGYYPNLVQEIGHVAFSHIIRGDKLSLEEVTSEWGAEFGYHWVPTILRPFQSEYAGSFAQLAGVSREEFVTNSLEAYGVLLRDDAGSLILAPYVSDLLRRDSSEGQTLEYLQALATSRKHRERGDLETTIERSLRLAFRTTAPSSEQEVQHYLDVILSAAGYEVLREGPTFHFSLRGYRPDHTVESEKLAIEVKLCKGPSDLSRVIEEMNADVQPYLKHYSTLMFVVFDLGGIYDIERFRTDFERDARIRVIVVKR